MRFAGARSVRAVIAASFCVVCRLRLGRFAKVARQHADACPATVADVARLRLARIVLCGKR